MVGETGLPGPLVELPERGPLVESRKAPESTSLSASSGSVLRHSASRARCQAASSAPRPGTSAPFAPGAATHCLTSGLRATAQIR